MNLINGWDNLPKEVVRRLENANVFYQEAFSKHSKRIGFDVFYLYDNNFIQVVEIKKIKRLFRVAYLTTEPYSFYDISEELLFASIQSFLNDLVLCLKKELNLDWLYATSPESIIKSYPSGSLRIPFGNYVIDLTKDIDTIFNNFSSSHRRDYRKAIQSNLTVKFGHIELLEEYLELDEELWRRNGKSSSSSKYYSSLLDDYDDNAIIGIAYLDGKPQCGRICLFNKQMCYCMYSATGDQHIKGAAQYLHFEFMKKMKDIGVHYYNFVGCRINVDPNSKPAGIQSFKERFGGELVNCYLFEFIYSPIKKKMFDIILRFFKKGKNILEQEIYKWPELNS